MVGQSHPVIHVAQLDGVHHGKQRGTDPSHLPFLLIQTPVWGSNEPN